MRALEIKYTEHKEIIFGNGIKKTDYVSGSNEKSIIKHFLNLKKIAGKIVVVNTIKNIPLSYVDGTPSRSQHDWARAE